MAQVRDRPYGNSNFLVDFGDGKAESISGGFSEVWFPTFYVDPVRASESASHMSPEPAETGAMPAAPAPPDRHLLLKRGFIGALDLYAWWNKERRGGSPKRRTLRIRLLAEDRETVVATWRFRGVRPVSLSYSPLRASEGGIVFETVELAFERMDML